VLDQTFYRKAIHGEGRERRGDSSQIAAPLRGGMIPDLSPPGGECARPEAFAGAAPTRSDEEPISSGTSGAQRPVRCCRCSSSRIIREEALRNFRGPLRGFVSVAADLAAA